MQTHTRVYFDHNATTPLHPAARAAMIDAFEVAGNPSSVHAEGRAARALLDTARRRTAALLAFSPDEVYFTSGGTEALNIVLSPALTANRQTFARLVIAGGEHPAVLKGHGFAPEQVEVVPLRPSGELNLDALADCVRGEPVLFALQAANNETGVVQPVGAASTIVHDAGGIVICDAVQAAGKVPLDFIAAADAIALSGHKFGAPKGIGVLCLRSSCHLPSGVVRGGGQERGLRSGTENVIGIAGFVAALDAAHGRLSETQALHAEWRNAIERVVDRVCGGVEFFGRSAPRLPNTSSFALSHGDAQVLLANLDLEGIAVSAGSACSSGKVSRSHVLASMGVAPETATRALRISLGWSTTENDVDRFGRALATVTNRMRPRAAA